MPLPGDPIRTVATNVDTAGEDIRTAADAVENASVSLVEVKEALGQASGVNAPHLAATNAMAGLLIDQSNFDGAEQ
jgi:hypothetical protein